MKNLAVYGFLPETNAVPHSSRDRAHGTQRQYLQNKELMFLAFCEKVNVLSTSVGPYSIRHKCIASSS